MEGVLAGHRGLVMGVANERSIAWGIAEAAHRQGAELAFTYAGEMQERRIGPLAARLGSDIVLPCDVQSDDDIESAFASLEERWETLDFLVHAIAFAGRESLRGLFLDTTREQFRLALDVSCYSLVAVAREAAGLMTQGGSILTLSYLGAERTLPHYNVMGWRRRGWSRPCATLLGTWGPAASGSTPSLPGRCAPWPPPVWAASTRCWTGTRPARPCGATRPRTMWATPHCSY